MTVDGHTSGRAPLWNELLAPMEYRRLMSDPVLQGRGVKAGRGRPVLVVPGFGASDLPMQTMVSWLRRTGHHTVHAHIGWNLWCGELTVGRLARRLEDLVAARGQRAVIVGHSRGGHFARVLAVRRPDLVRGVVTLGTPDLALEAIHPVLRLPAQALGLVGRAGVPRLFGPSCFNGSCCEEFRADLAGPLPARVAFTSVIGRRDGLVDPAWFGDSGARVVAIKASHIGLIVNADAYTAIAGFLAENPVRPRRPVPALTEVA